MSRSGSWWFTTAGFCDVTLAVCDPPAPQPRDPRVLPASFRRLGHATLACSRPLFALLAVLSAQPRVEGLGREHSRRCAAARARQRVRALGRPQYANAQRASTTTAPRTNFARSPRSAIGRWRGAPPLALDVLRPPRARSFVRAPQTAIRQRATGEQNIGAADEHRSQPAQRHRALAQPRPTSRARRPSASARALVCSFIRSIGRSSVCSQLTSSLVRSFVRAHQLRARLTHPRHTRPRGHSGARALAANSYRTSRVRNTMRARNTARSLTRWLYMRSRLSRSHTRSQHMRSRHTTRS